MTGVDTLDPRDEAYGLTLEQLEGRLYPLSANAIVPGDDFSGASPDGFLLPGQRLNRVRAEDDALIAAHGLTWEALGSALEKFLKSPKERLDAHETRVGLEVIGVTKVPEVLMDMFVYLVEPRYLLFERVALDIQECPWGCRDPLKNISGVPVYSGAEFAVLNMENGFGFTAGSMIIHLIRAHQFCEGPGTRFRTEPILMARTLNVLSKGTEPLTRLPLFRQLQDAARTLNQLPTNLDWFADFLRPREPGYDPFANLG
ncbi:MAG: hypothetical protein Kow00120_05110 [Anaerolineae bacterium]